MNFEKEKSEVAATMKRLYDRGLSTASGGNVSMRIKDGILITASQTDKGLIDASQVGLIDQDGKVMSGDLKLSMETGMHLAIYAKRPDINAIVHAHPVFATSFAISGKIIKTNLSGESRAVLGEPAFAEYALMGTQHLADLVAGASLKSNAVLMRNHGVITLGSSLFQAYDRMEVLEASAKMTFITEFLGGSHDLTVEQLKEIDNLFI
ncbi:MAG TPA: class II aldolase/adducin family protein [Bacteroidales bacterium]|mgnify:CR=1 FL=1|nr:class II aldolase/adducin family protein [Bacteroidales bacterium]